MLVKNVEKKYTILKLIKALLYTSWKKRKQSYFHTVHSIFIMSNTQNKIIFYDHSIEQFTKPAHVRFHEIFKQNPNASVEKIQQLS